MAAITFGNDTTVDIPQLRIGDDDDDGTMATPVDKQLELPAHLTRGNGEFVARDESVIDSSSDDEPWWDGVYETPVSEASEKELDLIEACKDNDIDLILTLIGDNIQKSEVNLDCRVCIGHPAPPQYSRRRRTVMYESSAFHICCEEGHLELVEYFIKREECNFHTTDMELRTPLHSACERGHLKIVKLLLKEQKVPNMLSEVDRLGRTPLYVAAQKGQFDVLNFLCKQTFRRKPDIDARANNQSTPLIAACKNAHLECVKLLVGKGANIESEMDKGVRPLMAAATITDESLSVDVCKFLLENDAQKAELNAVDHHNRTPFFMACQGENFPLVKYLAGFEEVNMKIACGFSFTGQEALLQKKNKEIGFWVRDLQRQRDKEKKDRIEQANRELGKKNEGPKKKQLLSDDEWKIVNEFKKGGRNLKVLDVLQYPSWKKKNWARDEFNEDQARKQRERKEMEDELKRAAEEEEKARKERMESQA
eukprot:CAMPEP_0118642770 /NCGR_PEP_ID=MMETSP0785-20121206/6011_1 /TAXON_ID=91992 /ORGANISM="Bolidomonas pacifica, Strain CCMP 1866" /LENGTH=480 /DNA_ID=CAMNT_0006534341 /DNA_START=105 /DNA_END=1544 /DNA_ORIENTATION=-